MDVEIRFGRGKTVDFCGCDILCIKRGERITLVQTTTKSHMQNRIQKISQLDSARNWIIEGRIFVHGWKPVNKARSKPEVSETEMVPAHFR